MVTLGVDCHKKTHTVVAVDRAGAKLAQCTANAISAGHLDLIRWASQWEERVWALEDCRSVSRRLETDLIGAGEKVLRVPPKLMAEARRSSREPGKSDPIDALAVAHASLRYPGLPIAQLSGEERNIRLLVDQRERLVKIRTGMQNHLLWALHSLDPEYIVKPATLDRYCVLQALEEHLLAFPGVEAELAIAMIHYIRNLTRDISNLAKRLNPMVLSISPRLLSLEGCGVISAATILGHTADILRFRSESAFAMFNGSAPIPASSGNSHHMRLNPGGNRLLNSVLYRIAITQIRLSGIGHAYYLKRLASGDTKREAIRALKRRISNQIFRLLRADAQASQALLAA